MADATEVEASVAAADASAAAASSPAAPPVRQVGVALTVEQESHRARREAFEALRLERGPHRPLLLVVALARLGVVRVGILKFANKTEEATEDGAR